MRAWNLLRQAPWYRHSAFSAGLRAVGFDVIEAQPSRPEQGDVLLIWNRYGGTHDIATRFEQAGGIVICCENGYLGHNGVSPKFNVHPRGPKPDDYYAIGIGFHNDATRWKGGGPERWEQVGVELKPWRTDGDHVLVLPNRAFGIPGRMMAEDWADRSAAQLKKSTIRRIVVRLHPGNNAPKRPLSADLEGAWAAVAWSSSAIAHALVAGIPTYIEAPFQALKGASAGGPIDAPDPPERLGHFQHLAWGQWELREVETGLPFRHLLPMANGL